MGKKDALEVQQETKWLLRSYQNWQGRRPQHEFFLIKRHIFGEIEKELN